MGRATRGCGCAVAVLAVVIGAAIVAWWKIGLPQWRLKPQPPSGGELQIHVLDVGPIEGDAILIVSPAGKVVLIDAGDTGKGKVVLDALKRYNVRQIDYFIATHPHPDHLGGADEVIKAIKVLAVIDNGLGPAVPPDLVPPNKSADGSPSLKKGAIKKPGLSASITKFYEEYRAAVEQSGAHYEKAEPGQKYDLGDGARLTILGPTLPFFTKEQMKSGGNEANANSVVLRLDYGDFSILLPGDAEEQTEHRLLTKDLNLTATILKVAHHGSKYATSEDFIKRVKPEVAIISCGDWNRYGHPSQVVLDRLRALGAKVYRTDLQGEITITTTGRVKGDKLYGIKASREAKTDIWIGRIAQKDDSTRAGFIAYGDFGPPPKNVNRKP
jgi:competence protein ComEC